MEELLTISEVARRSGVAASALRFYEQRGLIRAERAGSGHRRFPRAVLRRIAFIVFAQRIGLTLDEIAVELAKLPPNRAPTGRDWARLSGTWTARIDERDRGAEAAAGGVDGVHRVRLSVAGQMCAVERGGPGGTAGCGRALLDGRSSAEEVGFRRAALGPGAGVPMGGQPAEQAGVQRAARTSRSRTAAQLASCGGASTSTTSQPASSRAWREA